MAKKITGDSKKEADKKPVVEPTKTGTAKTAAKTKDNTIPSKPSPAANSKTSRAKATEEAKAVKLPADKTRAIKANPIKPKMPVTEEKTSGSVTPAPAATPVNSVKPYSLFTDFDVSLFKSGKHYKLYEKFGSHVIEFNGVIGTYFSVWAPNAQYISVIGNFNGWNRGSHPLLVRWDASGIWEGFIPNVGNDETYKYFIRSSSGEELEKSDPFALRWEVAPHTASIVADTYYEWTDKDWMTNRFQHNGIDKPYSVYEMHLGSWARGVESADQFLTYDQLAEKLVPYLVEMGFTHVEFMPLMEHPYYPSWGYQISGFYAASSRYGTPKQLMYLIEELHKAGIGVILDWVPSHFPGDAHALYRFDGSHLYEHEDMRKGFHPDWKSYIFNYGRNEVRAFLISNALFWLDRYHADGLRVDAVASMLYLDYSRNHGEWEPNIYGGNENLEAVSFLKEFNEAVYSHYPDTQTIAEESTSFTGVSRPVYAGGLGFGMKWMMGWMHDTIKYFSNDPVHRKYHHQQITFSLIYAFTENFMLPFSHDEVVYGKGSMLDKMPGDEWQKFANLRLLYSYMFTHPGTKLLFMGAEFGQGKEWNFEHSLDWHLLEYANHQGIKELVKGLNTVYRSEPALFEKGFDYSSFEWIDGGNSNDSILIYTRKGIDNENDIVVVLNMTPVTHHNYRIGVPAKGRWTEIFNSDNKHYWGGGLLNEKPLTSEKVNWHGKEDSISITVPPLGAAMFKLKK